MAYQLEPLRKALQLPRVNLFIADDVGLGKTIEAGLILRELLMRQKVRSVVVACPPSVILQWKDELENRFGLTFVVFDRDYVLSRRQERGYGVNPWTTHTRFIISHALLRDETYSGELRDWLKDFSPGSVLILDEAHNAAPASGARYAIDSYFTRVIRDLSRRFEHRLFLSATPHNGHSNSFAALLEILDPQRFCRGVPIKGPKLLEQVMVRRLKEDLRQIEGGFPERKVHEISLKGLPATAPELRLPSSLGVSVLVPENCQAIKVKAFWGDYRLLQSTGGAEGSAGIRNARANGKKLGRPKATADREQILKLQTEGYSLRKIAAMLGVALAIFSTRRNARVLISSTNRMTGRYFLVAPHPGPLLGAQLF